MKKIIPLFICLLFGLLSIKSRAQCTLNVAPAFGTSSVSTSSFCQGSVVQFVVTANATDGIPISNYSWSTGGTYDTIVVPSGALTYGTYYYTVTVYDVSSCSAMGTVTVTINSNPVDNITTGPVCAGEVTTLTANITDPSTSSIITYAWSPSLSTSDTADVIISTSTIEYSQVEDANGCLSLVASINLNPNTPPAIYITPTIDTICIGGFAAFNSFVTFNSTSSSSYSWTDGSFTDTAYVSPPGSTTYTLTYTDGNGCTATASAGVKVNGVPYTFIVDPSPTCYLTETTLSANITDTSSSSFTYAWSNSSTNDTADVTPPINTIYTLIVTDGNGCKDTATTLVQIWGLPVVTFSSIGFGNPVCEGITPLGITGGTPTGGTYSGPMVSGGMFTPSTSGTFWIQYSYTDNHGCTDTAGYAETVTPCLGINSISQAPDFELYPNPATSNLFVKFGNQWAGASAIFIVTDITGQVLSKSSNTIGNELIVPVDIAALPAGMYFIQVTLKNTMQVLKFVKE